MKAMSRAERRWLDRRVDKLVDRLEEAEARRELVKLSQEVGHKIMHYSIDDDGAILAFCASSNSLCCGIKEGVHCFCLVYGEDGQLLRSWEGDNLDLREAVFR